MAIKRTNDDLLMTQLNSCVHQEMYTGDIKIATLARKLFLSPSQLNRRVKQMTGKPVSAYVMDLRINHAKEMLAMSPLHTITDVAYACGFADIAHLTHSFRDHTGMSPSEYIQSVICQRE